jgi:hypothetical protein
MSSPDNSVRVREAAERLLVALTPLADRAAQNQLADQDYPAVSQALNACMSELAATGIWGSANRLLSSELWNLAGHLLARGWLPNQARIKPRGYAGDHEMLARIYQHQLCDDPLGCLFDRYFQEQAAPQAVRNRMHMMADWLVVRVQSTGDPVRAVVVGSALGLEMRDAIERLTPAQRERLWLVLLDIDPAALEIARASIEPRLPAGQLITASENLFRLPDRPKSAAWLDDADLLFCPGLFDYLDDAAASAMLATFWQRLTPGGRMWVFQFAPHNPTRAFMEWIGNWYLIYRTADDLRRLTAAAGIPPRAIQLGTEPLGIDLYLTASRD